MKKLSAVVVAFCCCIALFGCGKDNAAPKGSADTKKVETKSETREERAKKVVYKNYKPQSFYKDNVLYPQIYGKQGIMYYIDLNEAVIVKENSMPDNSKIYELHYLLITSDGIKAQTSAQKTFVRISDKVEPMKEIEKGKYQPLEYFGFTANQYNSALLLADFFKLGEGK